MAQLMPLPLTDSCFSKIQIGFTFLVPAHLGSPRQKAVERVCVCLEFIMYILCHCDIGSQVLQWSDECQSDDSCNMMLSCRSRLCQLQRMVTQKKTCNCHVVVKLDLLAGWELTKKAAENYVKSAAENIMSSWPRYQCVACFPNLILHFLWYIHINN